MQRHSFLLQNSRLLIVFEAAARLQSFTRAAEELNMQQPSVSGSIRQLEDNLSLRLFKRSHRKIELTRAGQRLFADIAQPMGSLEDSLQSIKQQGTRRLIHLEEPVRQRPTWSQWFSHHGQDTITLPRGLRLNDYALVLQAAVSGEGYAFGWDHVVKTMIQRRLLVGLTDWAWETGNSVYLVWPNDRPLAPKAEQVRDWIVASASN